MINSTARENLRQIIFKHDVHNPQKFNSTNSMTEQNRAQEALEQYIFANNEQKLCTENSIGSCLFLTDNKMPWKRRYFANFQLFLTRTINPKCFNK